MLRIIGGKFRNRTLKAPQGMETRPTANRLRETVFNMCQFHLEGALFLDLFSGTGAMGIEALSRGAQKAIFVEQSVQACRVLRDNLETLGVMSQAQVIQGDVFRQLDHFASLQKQFDLIYVDPPYGLVKEEGDLLLSDAVLCRVEEHRLLSEEGMLFLEQSSSAVERRKRPELSLLQLKSSRKVSKSLLEQYVYTETT